MEIRNIKGEDDSMDTIDTQQPSRISEYYIAYFDILGYQKFFRETPEKAENFLNIFHSAISKMKQNVQTFNESSIVSQFANLRIQLKIFSDNILLCIEVGANLSIEKVRLILFMVLVSEIQRKFIMEYGLFLRGGLTKGTLSFNDDYIFGEGLIEAVKMEGSTEHPRISVSDKVIRFLERVQLYSQEEADRAISIENRSKNGEKISEEDVVFYQRLLYLGRQESVANQLCMNLLYKCADDVWCLSYLYCIDIRSYISEADFKQIKELVKKVALEDYKKIPQTFPDLDIILKAHRDIVEKKLIKYSNYSGFSTEDIDKFDDYEKILKKYVWAMVYHNDMCIRYNKMNHFINTKGNCERRHMKLVINVCDENGDDLEKS